MELPVEYASLNWQTRKAVREEYINRQWGRCFFCNGLLNEPPQEYVTDKKVNWDLFPPNFLQHPIHLQHCHINGMTEGAVHALCNAVWWQYHGR